MSRYENRGPPSKRGRIERGNSSMGGGGGGGMSRGGGGHFLDAMKIEEELNRCDPTLRPNHILLFTILNPQYPIEVPVMHKVCSPIGKVLRIVIFRKGHVVHAMVEFDTVETASQAKRNLHGCDIYSGCCTLKVEFARTDRLHVKKNDDLTWDYTDEYMGRGGGSDGMMKADRPVLLNEPPQGGMSGGVNGTPGGMGGLPGMMGMMGGGGSGNGMGSSGGMMGMGNMMGGIMGAGGIPGSSGMGNMMGGVNGGMMGGAGGMSNLANNLGVLGAAMGSFMANNSGGARLMDGAGMSGGGPFGAMTAGNFNRDGMGGGHGRGPVCMVYGVEPDMFNCQRIFNLMCQYGNIRKVMFLKNKEGCVMVEMSDADAVQRAIDNLSNSAIFGLKLRLDWSKKDYITEIRKPYPLPDGTDNYMSFERDRNNRFDTPEKAAKNRILGPTKTLHFYNVPKMEDEDMESLFAKQGAPVPTRLKWFPSSSDRSASGLAEFDTVQEAAEALVLCNHASVEGNNIKYPYIMKLCFSQGPKADRDYRRDR